MKLIYRGITYDSNSFQASTHKFQQIHESEPADNLTYRGATYRVVSHTGVAKVSVLLNTYNLIYRGVSYCLHRVVKREIALIPLSASTLKSQAYLSCSHN